MHGHLNVKKGDYILADPTNLYKKYKHKHTKHLPL